MARKDKTQKRQSSGVKPANKGPKRAKIAKKAPTKGQKAPKKASKAPTGPKVGTLAAKGMTQRPEGLEGPNSMKHMGMCLTNAVKSAQGIRSAIRAMETIPDDQNYSRAVTDHMTGKTAGATTPGGLGFTEFEERLSRDWPVEMNVALKGVIIQCLHRAHRLGGRFKFDFDGAPPGDEFQTLIVMTPTSLTVRASVPRAALE